METLTGLGAAHSNLKPVSFQFNWAQSTKTLTLVSILIAETHRHCSSTAFVPPAAAIEERIQQRIHLRNHG